MIGDAVSHAADEVADRVAGRLEAAGITIALIAAALLSTAVAVVAASLAAGWALAPVYGAPAAGLIVAGGHLLLGLILFAIARTNVGAKPVSDAIEPMNVVEEEAEATMDSLGLPQFLLVAAGIGAALGMRATSSDEPNNQSPGLMSLLSTALTLLTTIQSMPPYDSAAPPNKQREPTANNLHEAA
jgi:hypothetical protein